MTCWTAVSGVVSAVAGFVDLLRIWLKIVLDCFGMSHLLGRHLFEAIKDKENQPQWKSFTLQNLVSSNPMRMDCLAIGSQQIDYIMEVIERFKEYNSVFQRARKPRRLTMLLHGPQGVGKWDTVRAIAHYLKFDIYIFDLGKIEYDELKTLVSLTKTNSVLMFKGVDQIGVHNLFPCLRELCEGGFRSVDHKQLQIFVAEDNNQLEPTFRQSIIQFELELPYCSPEVFRILAYRILRVTTIPNFDNISAYLSMAHALTPRAVENMLMETLVDSDATVCLTSFERNLSGMLGPLNLQGFSSSV